MSITLLDSLSPEPVAASVRAAVERLGDIGAVHVLHDERFSPCLGCFECWVSHPGTCKVHDGANTIMRDTMAADEVIWTVRPVYGCWSATAKQALDRTIGLVLPHFRSVEGETHHVLRYDRYPRLGVVAVCGPDVRDAGRMRFRTLVARNALNMGNPSAWVAEVAPDATEDDVARAIATARAEALPGLATLPAWPPRADASGIPPRDGLPRRALLLVGSAKAAGTSTSEHLGRALLDRLSARGWGVDVAHLARLVRLHRQDAAELGARIADVDLVILATPVYVDALPALVLAALERVAPGRHVHLLPLVQCGFPELSHTRLALEVLSEAVDRLGFQWAGHLAAGGAGALAGQDLTSPSGAAWRVVRALDATAAALDAGDPVPPEATLEFGTAPIPPWMYRLAGEAGWMFTALKEGGVLVAGRAVRAARPACVRTPALRGALRPGIPARRGNVKRGPCRAGSPPAPPRPGTCSATSWRRWARPTSPRSTGAWRSTRISSWATARTSRCARRAASSG